VRSPVLRRASWLFWVIQKQLYSTWASCRGFFDLTQITTANITAILIISALVPFVGNVLLAVLVNWIRALFKSADAMRKKYYLGLFTNFRIAVSPLKLMNKKPC
jgi:hypothetical protein